MVNYSERDLRVIDAFKRFEPSKERNAGTKYQQFLKQIPQAQKRYKCFNCFKYLNADDIVDGKCGSCGDNSRIVEACVLDTEGCGHTIESTIEYCPICGEVVCPACGNNHSVLTVSRVTGYLSATSGWNNSKKQELKDRVRSNLSLNGEMVNAIS